MFLEKCFILLIAFVFNGVWCHDCDQASGTVVHEGNVGEIQTFPWLGIIRVHIHEGASLKIALTGAVLVKDNFAVANADDLVKVPKKVFKEDSKLMFIPKAGEPWFCKLKDYLIHPEYQYATFNTIALVEIDHEGEMPIKAICWPGHLFNTSNELYAVGFTDERQLLEKVVYKIQYVKPDLCTEFYSRVGVSDFMKVPTHTVCGFAASNKNNCAWENGMVLASNSTGKWMMIGLGIAGPGCSAPARFIHMLPYLPWLETSATRHREIRYDDYYH